MDPMVMVPGPMAMMMVIIIRECRCCGEQGGCGDGYSDANLLHRYAPGKVPLA
jgi:hypothetical protein